MGISTSYNRRNGVRYAYDTTYEVDEATGRKVQRRRCVGHVDPETGEIVPNGRRGRPRVDDATASRGCATEAATAAAPPSEERIACVVDACETIVRACDELSRAAQGLAREVRLMGEA